MYDIKKIGKTTLFLARKKYHKLYYANKQKKKTQNNCYYAEIFDKNQHILHARGKINIIKQGKKGITTYNTLYYAKSVVKLNIL